MIKNNQEKKPGGGFRSFIKRNTPSDKDVAEFETIIEDKLLEEEIEDGLSEIYQDDSGRMVEVNKLKIKKQRGFLFYFLSFFGVLAVIGLILGGVYYYDNFLKGSDSSAVNLIVEADKNIIAGKEFYYTIKYENLDKVALENVQIKINYPENFIVTETKPAPVGVKNNNVWIFSNIESHRGGEIKIKGKLINEVGSSNILTAEMTYKAINFSSEFKKTAMIDTVIDSIGLNIDATTLESALVKQNQEVNIKYKLAEESYIPNFRLSVSLPEMASIIPLKKMPDGVVALENNSWQINNLNQEEREFSFKYKMDDKKNDEEKIVLKFEYKGEGEKYFPLATKEINLEVVKNNLNLVLNLNGSDKDQSFNLGDTLNYSLSYENVGNTPMKDVTIIAVLDSDYVDWTSLSDQNKGDLEGNMLSWTKDQINGLSYIDKGSKGIINFSVKIKDSSNINSLKGKKEIRSYAQFSFTKPSNSSATSTSEDIVSGDDSVNRSNVIIAKINSDLSLEEKIRYFDDDNIAVGTGPVPLKVGETTSLKVYWKINNTLHDLNNIEVSAVLPEYITWNSKEQASIGTINYDMASNKIYWRIGRLPAINTSNARAEFSINITPRESDRNKILVLSSGTSIKANDSETGANINKQNKVKTSKLEDDSIFINAKATVE